MSWNHNVQYHGFVANEIPSGCRRLLDVGCGQGALARALVRSSKQIFAIDTDGVCLQQATAATHGNANISFLRGDVLTCPFQTASFDVVAAVATLHHLPLRTALGRFHDLLRPGGVLVIVGLYRIATPADYIFSAAALPVSRILRLFRGEQDVGAPLQNPTETLRTVREVCASVLPGAVIRRRFFFRYTLVWKKP